MYGGLIPWLHPPALLLLCVKKRGGSLVHLSHHMRHHHDDVWSGVFVNPIMHDIYRSLKPYTRVCLSTTNSGLARKELKGVTEVLFKLVGFNLVT